MAPSSYNSPNLSLIIKALILIASVIQVNAQENEYQRLLSKVSNPAGRLMAFARKNLANNPELLNTAKSLAESAKRHATYAKGYTDPYKPLLNRVVPFTIGAVIGCNCALYPETSLGISAAAALNGGLALYGFCNPPKAQSEYSVAAKAGRFLLGGALCCNAAFMGLYSLHAFKNHSEAASIVGIGLCALAGLKALNMMGLHHMEARKIAPEIKAPEVPKAEVQTTAGAKATEQE